MTDKDQEKLATFSDRSPRLKRELATVITMIGIYCRAHHETTAPLCHHCSKLKDYVIERLSHCIFAGDKPTCAKCPVHCYKPSRRSEIITVMRYSGPRMMIHHPYLALRHVLDGRRVVKKLSSENCKKSSEKRESPQ
ncbi:MAG: nitrous oxide-stimulated promoter family protein [Desulfocapsaceae bacterium]|jgi:hypothetical protein|nr:nitrous oxide-stimulated promoter family protein [Desulfocapsaceae bacterium]